MPFAALPWLLCDSRMLFPIAQTVICLLGSLAGTWFRLHYLAPLTPTLFLLVVQAMRQLRLWVSSGRAVGISFTCVILLFAVAIIPIRAVQASRHPRSLLHFDNGMSERVRIDAQLETQQGEQLVVVRYPPTHNPQREWVYNQADIDHSKAVRAREISGVDIKPLLEFFRTREVWLVEPDVSPPRRSLYREAFNQE